MASVVALALPLAACARGDEDGGVATTTTRGSGAAIARVLEAAPRGCDAAPLVRRRVSPAYAPLLGADPVWFGPYLAIDRRRALLRIPDDAPRTEHGWRVKFLWIVRKQAPGPITLAGVDGRGRPLLFEPEDQALSDQGRLDPAGADPVASGFVEFPSYVYFPGAGCFELAARWPGGGWRLRFGAGR